MDVRTGSGPDRAAGVHADALEGARLEADLARTARDGGADWNRLRWRACRRGMKELDVLFERYLAADWAAAPEAERLAFLRLLDLPDPELAALCLGRAESSDPELAALVARLTDGRNARLQR